jgi:hypothetical protein
MRRFMVTAAALAATTVFAAGCAHTPWAPHEGWQVVRTKHITMYTPTKFAHKNTLETLELAYSALFATLFKNRRIAPVEVVFLESPAFLSTLGRYRNGITAARLPGKGHLARRGLVVMLEGTAIMTAMHKIGHLFMHAVAPRAPLWIHEGFASYVETLEYWADDNGSNAAACLGRLFFAESEIPLRELFSWTWAQYDESKKTDWYRFTASNLFDYFLMADGGAHRAGLFKLIEETGKGRPAEQVLAEIFPGVTVEGLQQKIVEHRRASEAKPRTLCPMPFPVAPEHAADYSHPRVEPLAKEDIEQLMVRLWMLPRRGGYVDWYPPESLTLTGVAPEPLVPRAPLEAAPVGAAPPARRISSSDGGAPPPPAPPPAAAGAPDGGAP